MVLKLISLCNIVALLYSCIATSSTIPKDKTTYLWPENYFSFIFPFISIDYNWWYTFEYSSTISSLINVHSFFEFCLYCLNYKMVYNSRFVETSLIKYACWYQHMTQQYSSHNSMLINPFITSCL